MKVKIVGQVTCHFGFASADFFSCGFKCRSGHVDWRINLKRDLSISKKCLLLLTVNLNFKFIYEIKFIVRDERILFLSYQFVNVRDPLY